MTKSELQEQMNELREGFQEMASEGFGYSEAFDIARAFTEEPGVEKAVKKHYGVDDAVEYVANYIA